MNSRQDVVPKYAGFTGQYIDGKWLDGSAAVPIVDKNPYDGAILTEISPASAKDLMVAYRSAADAQVEWAKSLPAERSAIFYRAAQIMDLRHEEIVDWLVKESGSTRTKAEIEWSAVRAGMLAAALLPTKVAGKILPVDIPNKEMASIQTVTQQNAAQVTCSSNASSNLMRKAERLVSVIANYNLGEQEFGTADEAKEMVKGAIASMQKVGRSAVLDEINAGEPKFLDRDLYLLVIDTVDSRILANSYAPQRVGAETSQLQDNNGKFFARDQIREVLANGHAWVDYNFVHPITKQVLPKSSYGEHYDGLLFSCGFFRRT